MTEILSGEEAAEAEALRGEEEANRVEATIEGVQKSVEKETPEQVVTSAKSLGGKISTPSIEVTVEILEKNPEQE